MKFRGRQARSSSQQLALLLHWRRDGQPGMQQRSPGTGASPADTVMAHPACTSARPLCQHVTGKEKRFPSCLQVPPCSLRHYKCKSKSDLSLGKAAMLCERAGKSRPMCHKAANDKVLHKSNIRLPNSLQDQKIEAFFQIRGIPSPPGICSLQHCPG